MITVLREIRHALRFVRRNKGFALAVMLSTSLGVGATASIFSLVDAILLRPLPVPETGRVVHLTPVTQDAPVGRFSDPEVDDIERRTQSFQGLATARNAVLGFSQRRGEQPRVTLGVLVNGDFFTTLRVAPALGRTFTAADDAVPGRNPVVVLGYPMWQREFGGRSDIIGQTLRLNGNEFAIVGVAPEWFTGVHPFLQPALYVPRTMLHEATGARVEALHDRTARAVDVFARLKAGVSTERARDDLRRLAASLEREDPAANKGRSAMVYSQLSYRIADAPDNFTLSWLFLTVAALVLSIASINVANLLLSTAPSRLREIAVRLAMGASRGRLLRQFLIESTVLSTGGTLVGLAIASVCAYLVRSIEVASELPIKLDAHVDPRVALFAFAIGLISGLVAGLAPAIRATRADLNAVLKATELRFARSRGWIRQALVVAQVAAALVMMVLSGLFIETVRVSRQSDPGFRVDHVLTMGLDPRIAGYEVDAAHAFYRRLIDRIDTLPGVRAAALGQHVPLGVTGSTTDIRIPGYQAGPQQSPVSIGSAVVSERYFDALGIPILRGRAFNARDRRDAPAVTIVNDVMAKKYWPTRDALGATLTIESTPIVTVQVVGIARVTKTRDITESPQPFLYLPLEQSRDTRMTMFVNTDGDAAALGAAARDALRAIDPNQPIYNVRTLASHFEQQALWGVRLVAEIIATVGIVGLALSVVGLYAVIAYSVSQRTREIGIRMAMGASERRVLGMLLRQGLTLAAVGVSSGLLVTVALSRALNEMLNGVNPRDPAVYAGGTAVVLAVTFVATFIPARRASAIDPQMALRSE